MPMTISTARKKKVSKAYRGRPLLKGVCIDLKENAFPQEGGNGKPRAIPGGVRAKREDGLTRLDAKGGLFHSLEEKENQALEGLRPGERAASKREGGLAVAILKIKCCCKQKRRKKLFSRLR